MDALDLILGNEVIKVFVAIGCSLLIAYLILSMQTLIRMNRGRSTKHPRLNTMRVSQADKPLIRCGKCGVVFDTQAARKLLDFKAGNPPVECVMCPNVNCSAIYDVQNRKIVE